MSVVREIGNACTNSLKKSLVRQLDFKGGGVNRFASSDLITKELSRRREQWFTTTLHNNQSTLLAFQQNSPIYIVVRKNTTEETGTNSVQSSKDTAA